MATLKTSLLWPRADVPPLAAGEVHVWAWVLDDPAVDLRSRVALLDASERDRQARFHFEADRYKFAISHGNMRLILASYLECDPGSLRYAVSAHHKPTLLSDAVPPLHFNLSHSSTVGLLAVAAHAELGVDVETIRPIEREVAQTSFSARELADLESLEGEDWLRGFYACWTRKEAILKAEGVGLNLPLADFDVSLLPTSPAGLIASRIPGMRPWQLHDLKPAGGAAGALAVEDVGMVVRCFVCPFTS